MAGYNYGYNQYPTYNTYPQYQQGYPQYQQLPNIPQPQQMQPQQMQPQQTQQQANQQIQSGGFISVRCIEEAFNYPVAPGNSVTFKDENAPYVYTKTKGFSQLEEPVFEKYRLVKEENGQQVAEKQQDDNSRENYALRSDLLDAISDIDDLKNQIKNLQKQVKSLKTQKKELPAVREESIDTEKGDEE